MQQPLSSQEYLPSQQNKRTSRKLSGGSQGRDTLVRYVNWLAAEERHNRSASSKERIRALSPEALRAPDTYFWTSLYPGYASAGHDTDWHCLSGNDGDGKHSHHHGVLSGRFSPQLFAGAPRARPSY